MMGLDRDALICDLAEVYHVFDYRALPARLVATLAAGLGPDSRIRMKEAGTTIKTDTMLLAIIADTAALILWMNTKNGRKGKNRPKSLVKVLMNGPEEETQTIGFSSGAEFSRWWTEKTQTGGANNA